MLITYSQDQARQRKGAYQIKIKLKLYAESFLKMSHFLAELNLIALINAKSLGTSLLLIQI